MNSQHVTYLTIWRAEIPQPDRFIQGAGDECVINRRHG